MNAKMWPFSVYFYYIHSLFEILISKKRIVAVNPTPTPNKKTPLKLAILIGYTRPLKGPQTINYLF